MTAGWLADSLPQAVILDLDGTLIESLPGIQFSAEEAVHALRPDFQLPDLRHHIGPSIGEVFQSVLHDPTREELDAMVANFRRSYDSVGWTMTTLFPGVGLLLDGLRALGVRLFVASNKPSLAAGRILRALKIESRFSVVVCRDSRTPPYASKSEAVGFLLREHGLDPDRVCMVGDGYDDYEAAHSNGAKFILAGYGYGSSRCRELAPLEARASSPGDLLALIQRSASSGNR